MRRKAPSFTDAVRWIAVNDGVGIMSRAVLMKAVSVKIVADLWGRDPEYVAGRVLAERGKT